MRSRFLALPALAVLLLVLAAPGTAQAATCTFDGSSGTDWNTARQLGLPGGGGRADGG